MRFSVWPRSSNPYAETLELARHAEATGWDGLWFADHLMPGADDATQPVNESFTVLAALAASVPRVRIGHMVAGNTYRHPAVTAKMAAGIDRISGGRFVLGLGAGWQENEHRAYGLPFYTTAERLARLDEACQIVTSLFANERTTFDGAYYRLDDAPLSPKPLQDPLPLMIGGGGERVTLRIAAKYAHEWNAFGTPEVMKHKSEVLDRHCAEVGRDPAMISRSVGLTLEPSERADVDAIKRAVSAYAAVGMDEIIVGDFTLGGGGQQLLDAMDRFISEVAPEFR